MYLSQMRLRPVYIYKARRCDASRCLVTATLDAEILIVPREHEAAFWIARINWVHKENVRRAVYTGRSISIARLLGLGENPIFIPHSARNYARDRLSRVLESRLTKLIRDRTRRDLKVQRSIDWQESVVRVGAQCREETSRERYVRCVPRVLLAVSVFF